MRGMIGRRDALVAIVSDVLLGIEQSLRIVFVWFGKYWLVFRLE